MAEGCSHPGRGECCLPAASGRALRPKPSWCLQACCCSSSCSCAFLCSASSSLWGVVGPAVPPRSFILNCSSCASWWLCCSVLQSCFQALGSAEGPLRAWGFWPSRCRPGHTPFPCCPHPEEGTRKSEPGRWMLCAELHRESV